MPCEYSLLIRRQQRPCLLAIDDGLGLAGQHAGCGPAPLYCIAVHDCLMLTERINDDNDDGDDDGGQGRVNSGKGKARKKREGEENRRQGTDERGKGPLFLTKFHSHRCNMSSF